VSSKYMASGQRRGLAPLGLLAWRYQLGGAYIGLQQQLFQLGAFHALQTAPFLQGHQHSGLSAAFGHHLWAMGQASGQQLAKTCFGILNGP
jgi:hypothetical protein